VVKGDEIKIATVMSVSLSTDHRVVDGALGAVFLQEFKRLVEDPLALLL
jgi:pyruvate dehydrogenase E2 component (dihydrolipoamide acetyltransferase)